MQALEIHSRMISLEERINILEHNLDMNFGNRHDRANNSDSQIKERIQSLNDEWDRLEIELAK